MRRDEQIIRLPKGVVADETVALRAAELVEAEALLGDRELLVKTCTAGLRAFEISYTRAVRPKYAELDRVEADIATALLSFDPEDETLIARAREARERAEASERASSTVAADDDTSCHTPSVGLKRLFRRVALSLHPDRCSDPDESAYRHDLMVEANRAYRDGDDGLLETLLGLFEAGDEVPAATAELRRVLWRLSSVRRRLSEIDRELEEIQTSEIFLLWRQSEAAADQGQDFIRDRVATIDRSLAKARARLEVLLAVA